MPQVLQSVSNQMATCWCCQFFLIPKTIFKKRVTKLSFFTVHLEFIVQVKTFVIVH